MGLQRQVWRGVLMDETLTVTSDVNGHRGELPTPGVGLAVSASLESTPSAVQADSHLVVGLETQLPDGSWHLFLRWSRHSAAATTKRTRLAELNVLKLASQETTPNDGVATTDTAFLADDILITGPIRARFAVTNGGAATIDWDVKVTVAVIGQPAVVE